MLPILLQIGFFKIYTFGIFLVLAFFWGAFYLWKNIQLTSFKEDEIFDGLFIGLAGGAIVGRLVHVILHFSDFGLNILKIILVNGYPGFSMWGGILGFFLFIYFFCNSHKIKFEDLIDYLIPPVFLALAIGKIGSFFAGVEIGTITTIPVAIKYAGIDGMRHLTPLYEGILLFIATYVAHKMVFTVRRGGLSRGFLLLFFFWVYSAIYAGFDFIREGKAEIMGYSAFGILAFIILLTLSLYFVYYFRATIFQPIIRIFKK